jgi:thioester reductase-like protein
VSDCGCCVAHLLRALQDRTSADLYCLVRARDATEGLERISEAARKYGVDGRCDPARVLPVVGDLALPGLGLSSQQFASLAATADLILHSGSLVNFLQPYSALRASNVGGTIVRNHPRGYLSDSVLTLFIRS